MKISLLTKTKFSLATYALLFMTGFCLAFFYFIIKVFDPDGGEYFFDNLLLSIPVFLAWMFGSIGFFTGLISLIIDKIKSVLTLILTLLGGFIFLFGLLEILFPH
jgi:hypothetical protein